MKIEFDKTKDKVIQVLCQQCKRNTRHIVLRSVDTSYSEDWGDGFFSAESKYQVIQCLGCEEISFRTESSNSEDIDPEYGPVISEVIYPRRTMETINIKSYLNLPYHLNRIYKETIECYNNDLMTLCGAGARALVEGLCKEKSVKDGPVEEIKSDGSRIIKREKNLQGRINGLAEKGILTKKNADILHEHCFLGNEALHELSLPTKEELSLAITIIEHVLDSIYELPVKASKLRYARKKAGHA